MKNIFQLSLVIIILLAISSCSTINSKNAPLQVIASEECTATCWRGITTGVTTLDEAWALVQQMMQERNPDEVVPTEIEKDTLDRYITIYFGKITLTFYADSDGVIEDGELSFRLLRRSEKPKLTDLLSVYGEPDSIEICHDLMEMRRAIVYIYYPQMYFLFVQTLPIEGESFDVSIEKSTHIDYITLLPQSYEHPVYDFSFPWAGYGDVLITPAQANSGSICEKLFP